MNKYLPIVLIVAVLLFAAAGFFYVSSQKSQSAVQKVLDATPTPPSTNQGSPSPTMPVPTEAISTAMIPLTVDSPKEGSSTTSSKLLVSGHTSPYAEVFVNDVSAKADRNGNFKATLTLDEGDNYILIFANEEGGNYAQREMTVTYVAP